MRPVLRPGSVVLRRDPTHLQVGTTPRHAHVLRDAPGLVELIRLMDGVRDLAALRLDAGRHAAALARDVGEVVGELCAAGVVVDADQWGVAPPPARLEAAHLACRGVGPDAGARRLARRAASRVEVISCPGLATLCGHLVDILTTAAVPCSTTPTDAPDLVVVLTDRPSPREPFEVLQHGGLTHLPVFLEQGRAHVGPLVVPGRTPCVTCADAGRTTWDAAWPALLAQLDQPLCTPPEHGPDGLSAVTAPIVAAAVATEVLAHLDDEGASTYGAVLAVGPGPWDLDCVPAGFHPGCTCRGSFGQEPSPR
ncbi:MAG: TOMM precursor leader peptide-binding protein [Nocardioidaceae bacterium]|nr:TOMM precursor leader peptide-binding protein [Nocardioidaceae bacterium]